MALVLLNNFIVEVARKNEVGLKIELSISVCLFNISVIITT